jgi:hypothetical protein
MSFKNGFSYLSEAEDDFTPVHRVFVPLLLKGKELKRAVRTQSFIHCRQAQKGMLG